MNEGMLRSAGTPVDPKPYVPNSFSGIPAAVLVLVVTAVRPRMARSKLLGYFNSLAQAREMRWLSRVLGFRLNSTVPLSPRKIPRPWQLDNPEGLQRRLGQEKGESWLQATEFQERLEVVFEQL
jgi:hypothetical protein